MISIESNVYRDGVGGQLLIEDEHLFASRLYELEVVGILKSKLISGKNRWMRRQ